MITVRDAVFQVERSSPTEQVSCGPSKRQAPRALSRRRSAAQPISGSQRKGCPMSTREGSSAAVNTGASPSSCRHSKSRPPRKLERRDRRPRRVVASGAARSRSAVPGQSTQRRTVAGRRGRRRDVLRRQRETAWAQWYRAIDSTLRPVRARDNSSIARSNRSQASIGAGDDRHGAGRSSCGGNQGGPDRQPKRCSAA